MANGEALTFEKVWDMFQETDRRFKETDLKFKETDRQIQETAREIKETTRQIGKLGNRFGELVEHLVAPSIKEKFLALNLNFEHISQNHQISDKEGHSLAEIDLLLENGDIVIAVEVKSKPLQKDVDEHIHRMEILRQRADVRHDNRKLRGAGSGSFVMLAYFPMTLLPTPCPWG